MTLSNSPGESANSTGDGPKARHETPAATCSLSSLEGVRQKDELQLIGEKKDCGASLYVWSPSGEHAELQRAAVFVLPAERLLGGAPANFCYRLRQLGVPARLVSRVGADPLGDDLLAQLESRSFDLSLVQIDPHIPTGTVDVVLTTEGNPSFTINTNVAYDFLEATEELLAAAKDSRLICFGTLVQRSSRTRETVYRVLDTAVSATKFLDINLRKECYSKETVAESWSLQFQNATPSIELAFYPALNS